jgi:LmbE family N-acetylglucosaminyl deacetylase
MNTRHAAVLLLFLALPLHGRERAVRHPSQPSAPSSVMWIAAHPDDEAVVAPLLAYWCLELNAHCTLLVVTRGEAGPCLLPEGCHPDVRTVRSAEHGAGAEYFRADSILLRWPDGGGASLPSWETRPAARAQIRATVKRYIEAVRPQAILTFDPRHGTTCHPDHREIGRIVLDAIGHLTFQPDVYLLQTRVRFGNGAGALQFTSATAEAVRFDATAVLSSSGEPAWNAILDDMRRHPSQFDENWLAAVEAVPPHERAVFYAGPEILGRPADGCE